MTRTLILVKHSLPEIQAMLPARDWSLSPEGVRRCSLLTEQLRAYRPFAIVSSKERKAQETASLLSLYLKQTYEVGENLHEHERGGVGFLATEVFEETLQRFFAFPEMLVFGDETARQAQERFVHAVSQVLESYQQGNIVIVTHGTVMTLLLCLYNHLNPFLCWKSLGLPSYALLTLPEYRLQKLVESVETNLSSS